MFATTKETLFGTIVLLLSSSCSIICGAACDWIEPGECLGVGEIFGPCNPDGSCSPDLQCIESTKGWICIPGAVAADDWEAATCASWRGDMACSKEKDMCFLGCDGPDACKGGTVCDENAGMCVYPYESQVLPDVGESYGPCDARDTCAAGNTCVKRTYGAIAGDICLPACDVCETPEAIEASMSIGNLAPSCTSDNLCATPCSTQDDCLGDAVCMEGICFRTDVLL